MAEQTISIGGKRYDVACQDGEEQLLQTAAAMLDAEAQTVLAQAGRMPEGRLLLMAGLLLADRTVAADRAVADLQAHAAALEAEIAALRAAPAPEPVRVEVPVIPGEVTDRMAEFAARAEALAARLEERCA
ncbi:MAG: cell division protein ZapA [Alkalilacustris sp.]